MTYNFLHSQIKLHIKEVRATSIFNVFDVKIFRSKVVMTRKFVIQARIQLSKEVSQKMSHLSCTKEGCEWRNFQLSNASHSQPFLCIFKDFSILSNPEQTKITPPFFLFWGGWGSFLDKNPHNCNINTRNTYQDHLCKLPELIYN